MTDISYPCGTEISAAGLLPPYVEDKEVKLIRSDADGLLFTPEWFGSLIMTEIHPETATPEGTLVSLLPVLDHLAGMGVNGIWITPIYKKGDGNGYGNWGPHTLEPAVTGVEDTEEGWRRVAEFVKEAHRRNIRVFLDIISWGTVHSSPLVTEHPDWFKGEVWGGAAFNWDNDEFRAWFIDVCIENILKSGADGYRCDCEPMFSGYRVFAEIRTRLLALGRKIAVIAEESSERRGTYDSEQDGITGWIEWSRGQQYKAPKRYFIDGENIVDCIKSGKLHGDAAAQKNGTSGRNKFYTYCVSNHDYEYSITEMNRLVMGYQAIFAPFIPLWYLGAEFGMHAENKVIYFVPTDWSLLEKEENRKFCRDITEYIRIRRSFPEIFCCFPEDHRNANIAAAEADTELQTYVRFAPDGSRAIIVVPRKYEEKNTFSVSVDLDAIGVSGDLKLTDLLTGKDVPLRPDAQGKAKFSACVPEQNSLGVYLLEHGI